MYGKTLILDAFWVSNKTFPTALAPNFGDGRAFHDLYCGEARYLGWMDLVLLKDIIKKHNIKHIILQNLDTFGKIAAITREIKVCVAYDYNRFIVHSFSQKKELLHCTPIYQSVEFGGWELSDEDDIIPSRAQYYIRNLLIHTRVDSITCMTNKVKLTAHFDLLGRVVFESEPN